jgi:hypothetical protein
MSLSTPIRNKTTEFFNIKFSAQVRPVTVRYTYMRLKDGEKPGYSSIEVLYYPSVRARLGTIDLRLNCIMT